jgi:hypothetical protein
VLPNIQVKGDQIIDKRAHRERVASRLTLLTLADEVIE